MNAFCFCDSAIGIQLKGYPPSKVNAEVNRMISVLCLEDKRNTAAKDLSGGMKRKLCVGIALIAGSKVTMLIICRIMKLRKTITRWFYV